MPHCLLIDTSGEVRELHLTKELPDYRLGFDEAAPLRPEPKQDRKVSKPERKQDQGAAQ